MAVIVRKYDETRHHIRPSHGSPPLTLFVEPLTYSVLRPTARLARPNGLYDSYRLLIRGILIPYKTYYSDIKKCLAFAFAN